jgi:hypothetical protein
MRARRRGYEPPAAREPWQCECGERYLVAGRDRHRIYWLEADPDGGPVLSGSCPTCERPLPTGA